MYLNLQKEENVVVQTSPRNKSIYPNENAEWLPISKIKLPPCMINIKKIYAKVFVMANCDCVNIRTTGKVSPWS